jgi:signal peptidase I
MLKERENLIVGVTLCAIGIYLSLYFRWFIIVFVLGAIFLVYKEFYVKVKNVFVYIFFGDDIKSDIIFVAILLTIYIAIQLTFPYLISVVMTTSMEHTYFSIEKYKPYNITLQEFEGWPFPNGINRGDIVIILPVSDPLVDIRVGDVVLYKGVYGRPIMHRVIKKVDDKCFVIMGDNNPGPLVYEGETCMPPRRIIGKVVFRIPYLGLPKVWISNLLQIW